MFNKKILCLGHNGNDTDHVVSMLANADNATNHGLISGGMFVPESFGYYHTSIVDSSYGEILQFAEYFDTIILLDQPVDQWSHWKLLLSTYKLMLELDQLHNTVYKNNANIKKYEFFDKMVVENKSFCIYPWIELINDMGYLTTCARADKKITTIGELGDWQTNPHYNKIRESMLNGKLLPDNCESCYMYERNGIESYRMFETKEWLAKLDISTVEELNAITHPYYYEIRLNNTCNLKCRGCRPSFSNSIEKEYAKHNIKPPFNDEDYAYSTFNDEDYAYSTLDILDIQSLNPSVRVYLTGGEPTIMSEVYLFMENCISAGKTDFDFTLGTNAVKLNDRFLELSTHFSNMGFSVSLDGYGKINDYWRSGSDFDTIIKNTKLLQSMGHNISINCVPGIYNVSNLHLLFEFLDMEFPHCGMYLQINCNTLQSAYNHPNAKLVIDSMEKCKQTTTYHRDGKSTKTCIDSLYDHYNSNPTFDKESLKQFFEYNDKLDSVRNVRLIDFIPELEECRAFITKS